MRKNYDNSEDYFDAPEVATIVKLRPKLGIRRADVFIAAVIGLLVAVAHAVASYPSLNPEVWNDAAVAAGLRPPAAIFPGFWRVVAKLCYAAGIGAGNAALMWAGRVCAGVIAFAAYFLFEFMLVMLSRRTVKITGRRLFIYRVAAVLGTTFLMFSNPMWHVGQTFSPAGLTFLHTLAAIATFLGFLLRGAKFSAFLSMFLLGSLTAETPFGFVLLAACIAVYCIARNHGMVCEGMPLLNPLSSQYMRWGLTFGWALGLLSGIVLNCASYCWTDGMAAAGLSLGDLPLAYLVNWWRTAVSAASPIAWILGGFVCVVTFVVAMVMMPQSTDEDELLPYHGGIVSLFTGLLAYAQLAMIAPLWFWMWTEDVVVRSPYLLLLFVCCSAATVAMSVAVFGVECYCRNHQLVISRQYASLRSDDSGDVDMKAALRKRSRLVIFAAVCIALVAGALPGLFVDRTREMLKIVEEYAHEVVNECGNAKWLFTDGSYDSKLELIAAGRGLDLKAVSFMAGNSAYEQYVRHRGIADEEDRLSAAIGAPILLRSWMREKPERLAECATQIGLEFWRRDGLELPPCSGVLSRPAGMPEAELSAGIGRSRALADKIFNYYAKGPIDKRAGALIRDRFLFAQWRLARFARMRGEIADRGGDLQQSEECEALSERLDDLNESLRRLLHAARMRDRDLNRVITPRQNLLHALNNADFALANLCAEPILKANPEDPDANFAIGMNYYRLKQWARAEEHLKIAAKARPGQPAFWNNLAMVCMHAGRFDEAEQHAKKALAIIPNSAEVKDTLKQIAKARQAAAEKQKKTKKESVYRK